MCGPQLLTAWYLLTIYLYNKEQQQGNENVDMIPCYSIFTERSQTSKQGSLPVTKQPCCQSVSPSVV